LYNDTPYKVIPRTNTEKNGTCQNLLDTEICYVPGISEQKIVPKNSANKYIL